MKRILLSLACLFTTVIVAAPVAGPISDAMKKYHKGDTATCKKVKAGTATPAELAEILKSYESMSSAKPELGTPASWKEKCDALIAAVKEIQSNNPKGVSDYKKAVDCKACHDVHKVKKQ